MADPISPLAPESSGVSNVDDSCSPSTGSDNVLLSTSLGALQCPPAPKLRADGQPMQKRGPKPRNQPPLNRKQELARRAQRSHKERKEQYVRALEQEVLQLKNDVSLLSGGYESIESENRQLKSNMNIFSSKAKAVEEENRQLRALLERCGVTCPVSEAQEDQMIMPGPVPQTMDESPIQDATANTSSFSKQPGTESMPDTAPQNGIDYDQLGIDFVLSFENACLRHMRVDHQGDELYGHALMASCNPGVYPEMGADIPFGSSGSKSTAEQDALNLSKSGFENLLHHSQRLNLDGEVTPVMVWQMLVEHPQYLEFTTEDFERIRQDLAGKVRCYGFGAVFEEFEVRDIIDNFVLSKDVVAPTLGTEGSMGQY